MARITAERVLETSTTTGTGTYTLAGAVTGFRAASTVCANGDTFYYYAEEVDTNGTASGGWEAGLGTWSTGGLLARTTIISSSNAGAAVSWAAGTRRVGLSINTKSALNRVEILGAGNVVGGISQSYYADGGLIIDSVITGTQGASTGGVFGMAVQPALTGQANYDAWGLITNLGYVKAASGTTPSIAATLVNAPYIQGAGTAPVTIASSLQVNNKSTIGVSNYGLYLSGTANLVASSSTTNWIGSVPASWGDDVGLGITPTFTGTQGATTGGAIGVFVNSSITGQVGYQILGSTFSLDPIRAASGTHSKVANVLIQNMGAGGGGVATVTSAMSLDVEGPPTFATNNFTIKTNAGRVQFGGTTQNANNASGLTIHQAVTNSEMISLKGGDVAHGMTNNTETDTYGVIRPISYTGQGGISIDGYSESNFAMALSGTVTTADTTKTTAARAAIELNAGIKSGAGGAQLGTTSNLLSIVNWSVSRFLFDASGVMTSLGTTSTMSIGNGAITTNAATALSITTGTTGALTIDSGTTGAINLGTNANAKTLTIGNTTGATSVVINSGTAGISLTKYTVVTGSIHAKTAVGTNGYVGLIPGSASYTGYIEFISHTNGFRQGYIGFSSTTGTTDTGTIPYIAGTHAFTGAITGSSTLLTTSSITAPTHYVTAASGNGLGFWASAPLVYGILMSAAADGTYGGRISGETTSDYNLYFGMLGGTNRGFVFRTSYATTQFAINPNGVRSNVPLYVTNSLDGALSDSITVQNTGITAGTEAGIFFAPTTATGNIRGARISGHQEGSNNIGLKFYTGVGASITEKMRIDGSGKIGVNTAPSGKSIFEVYTGTGAFNGVSARFNAANYPISFGIANANGFPYLGFNSRQVSSTDGQTYDLTGFASRMDANGGGFKFYTAPSGTAGAAITFTQAMVISSEGSLSMNAPASTAAFQHWITNTSTLTSSYASLYVGNVANTTSSLAFATFGTAYTTSGAYKQDGSVIDGGNGLAGGLSIVAQAGGIRLYTGGASDTNLRLAVSNTGNLTMEAPAATGAYEHYITNASTATSTYASLGVGNGGDRYSSVRIITLGTAWTTNGGYVMDAAVIDQGSSLSGGLSIISNVGNMRFYSGGNSTAKLAATIDTNGNFSFKSTGSTLANVSSINGGQLAGFRNVLINGNFNVDQRSLSLAVNLVSTPFYSIDRWASFSNATASGTLTVKQVAGDSNSTSALRFAKTAGTYNSILYTYQVIESINCLRFAGKTITVSFRARKGSSWSGTGVPMVSLYTGTGVDQGGASGLANTWTGAANPTKTTIAEPTVSTSFQNYSYSFAIGSTVTEIMILLGCTTTATTGTANDYWDFTDVQIEDGTVPTPFEERSYGQEILLCKRYFRNINGGLVGFCSGTTIIQFGVAYDTPMRVAPTMIAGASLATINWSGNSNVNPSSVSITTISNTVNGYEFRSGNYTGLTSGQAAVLVTTGDKYAMLSSEL